MLNYHNGNLAVSSLNTLKPHASFYYYDSLEKALKGGYLKKEFTLDLSGIWKIKVFDTYEESEGYELNPIADKLITVPGHLELNGYGKPKYTQTTEYSFESEEDCYPPFVPKKNLTACYYKELEIDSKSFLNKDVILTLNGVESCFYLYVNKSFVGYASSSFNTHEFNLTEFLKAGKNEIVIKVSKYGTGSYLEDQDMFRFSGIFRDLYLSFLPKKRINDVKVTSKLLNNYQDGLLNVKVTAPIDVKVSLYDHQKIIYEGAEKCFEVLLNKIKPYHFETPNLYTLVLEFKDGPKSYYASLKVGFKRIKRKDNTILINGEKLLIKGVNRHEWEGHVGRAISLKDIKKDLLQIKKYNINTIRTSHYPNHPYFYELCDELGIMVIDENNLETHGTWFWGQGDTKNTIPGNQACWNQACLERIMNLYERDKNHPSIISFSLGNEAFGGKIFEKMADYLRSQDNNFFVHYEGVYHYPKSSGCSDVTSEMYATLDRCYEYAKNPTKPYFLCEFSHAMGNSNGNFLEYMEFFKKHDFAIGGCIWDFKDQTLVGPDKNILYGGDFGEVTKYGNFSGNGLVTGTNQVYPKIYEIRYGYQSIDFKLVDESLLIKNNYQYLNLNNFIFKIKIIKGREVYEKEISFNCLPKESVSYSLKKYLDSPYETIINVLAFKKQTKNLTYENAVASESLIYHEHIYQEEPSEERKVEVYDGFGSASVTIDDFYVHFNKRLATLTEIRYQGRTLFNGIMEANFYRSLVSNDIGAKLDCTLAGFKNLGLNTTGFLTEITKTSDKVLLKANQTIYTNPVSSLDLEFEVAYNSIVVNLTYHGQAKSIMPAFGIKFKLSDEYHLVDYLGRGPYANYWDRKAGSLIDNYAFDLYNNIGLNINPQEDGNHCDVKKAFIHNEKFEGLEFSGLNEFELSALPYSADELDFATHLNDLKNFKKHPYIILNYHQMGVGGIDSWLSKPLDKYLLKADETYQFSFKIKGR